MGSGKLDAWLDRGLFGVEMPLLAGCTFLLQNNWLRLRQAIFLGPCPLPFPLFRWEAQFNDHAERVAGNAFRNELLGFNEAQVAGMARPVPCPSCGQPNYRIANNNHVGCWSCTGHFCAICRTVLRRGQGATHFGPTKPCRQHTAG